MVSYTVDSASVLLLFHIELHVQASALILNPLFDLRPLHHGLQQLSGKLVRLVHGLSVQDFEVFLNAVAWVLASPFFTSFPQLALNIFESFSKGFIKIPNLIQMRFCLLQSVVDFFLERSHAFFIELLCITLATLRRSKFAMLVDPRLDLQLDAALRISIHLILHLFVDKFAIGFLLFASSEISEKLALSLARRVNLAAWGQHLGVVDPAVHLLKHARVSLRALALGVRVGKPVSNQLLVLLDLIIQQQCNAMGHLSHDLLQPLAAHHLPCPEHLVLTELLGKVALLHKR